MLTTLATLFALLFGFTGAPAVTAAPETTATQATDVLWPAVDNRFAAMTQCHYFLDAGADRDDCLSSAQDAFPPLAACMEEDSNGPCYWSATTRGNGSGEAFTVDADGVVTLIGAVLR